MYPILEPIIHFEKKGLGVSKAPPPLPMHFSNYKSIATILNNST
jgi:hypothetical protein